jgi:3-oxoacyl-[acyl-carrier-protein] synthase-1
MGIVSCLGNELDTVEQSLRAGRRGIAFAPEFRDNGLRSRVCGLPDMSSEPPVERKIRRFMGEPALYAHHAMRKALADARLIPGELSNPRYGLVVGSGSGSMLQFVEAIDAIRTKGLDSASPYAVPQAMGSTVSACLATAYGIRGLSYSISSACATSAHCIGHASDLIRSGKQDLVFAGGAEEARWPSAALFDAMGALSTNYNESPQAASRPYDAGRDGFVIAGGSGIVVLESLEHALARRAHIHAELVGYGASCDGSDMIVPAADGMARAMRSALDEAGLRTVDYINAHGTSTQAGDLIELEAIRKVFGAQMPLISSTKGLSGHAIGASGVHETIYSLLMMRSGFVAACANLDALDPAVQGYPLVTRCEQRLIRTVMSNSLGFGGSNACLLFRS